MATATPSIDVRVTRISPFHTAFSAVAVALVAAALGDPLVESISNAGVFGHAFVDASQQSVIPVLLAGMFGALLLAAARVRWAFDRHAGRSRDWLRGIALACARGAGPRHVAAIFAVELATVYAMECGEALLGSGQPVHGLSWLGAPAAISIGIHLVVCIACVLGARGITRVFLAGMLAVMCDAFDRLLAELSRATAGAIAHRTRDRFASRIELIASRRVRGRAPPILAALA